MSTTLPQFSGFPEVGIDLLAELPKRDKEWFNDWRSLYEESLLEPAKALVLSLGDRLQDRISPSLQAKPAVNGSISPIFRDLRFSPDKTVFKDYLMLNFWDGAPKKTAPTLRVRITPTKIGFAAGAVFPNQPELDLWRDAVANDAKGAKLRSALDGLLREKRADLSEPELKKPPVGIRLDHPRADLLRRKSLQIRWQESAPKSIHKAAFADWCSIRLEKLKAIHLWLKEELQDA